MSDPYGITFSYEPFDPMNEDHKRLNISYGAGIHIVVARAHALTRRTR